MNRRDSIESKFQLYVNMISIEKILVELNEVMTGDITGTIRSISSGIDVVKKLTELAFKTQNIELQEGVLSLREKLAEAKEALLEAKEEISSCRENDLENKQRIKTLEKEIESLKNPEFKIVFKNGAYYKENNEHPLCTGCYDNNGKQILLNEMNPTFKSIASHTCPVCKAKYTIK